MTSPAAFPGRHRRPGAENTTQPLLLKQQQFVVAVTRYQQQPVYRYIKRLLSLINCGLLLFWGVRLCSAPPPLWPAVSLFPLIYFLSDFINGFVHLLMDNADHYTGFTGPMIAVFHLHHAHPLYTPATIINIFTGEAGYKVWLAVLQLMLLGAGLLVNYSPTVIYCIFLFCFSSCLAEVSHYLCHNSRDPFVQMLQRLRILLPVNQHVIHHQQDNTHYAFLNGMSNPCLDWLARQYFKGYQQHTDLHYQLYRRQFQHPSAHPSSHS